ncbi:hypothetical protein D7Y04_08150 [Corallococcus sp. AB038B]|nr:hypothetical protein D7Y04_08150 [Corallococcus sp. AB038B]
MGREARADGGGGLRGGPARGGTGLGTGAGGDPGPGGGRGGAGDVQPDRGESQTHAAVPGKDST